MRGHLEERSPGHWRVRVFVGRRPDGRPIYKSRTFLSPAGRRRDAEKAAAVVVAQLLQERVEPGTMAALLEWRADAPGLAGSTRKNEQPILERIGRDFNGRKVETIQPYELDQWYRTLAREGRSQTTVSRYAAVMRAMLIQAERYGWINRSAHRNSSMPQANSAEVIPPPPAVMMRLLEHAEAISPEFGLAVRLAMASGARRGELLALRWSDLDGRTMNIRRALTTREDGTVVLGPTKGRRARSLELDETTLTQLGRHLERLMAPAARAGVELHPDSYVIADRRADPFGLVYRQPNWLTLKWGRLVDKLGYDVRWHDTRHFHATELLAAGVPLPVVSRRLGHAKTSTTANIYAHAIPSGDSQAAEAIGALFQPAISMPQLER